ncbi:poly-beta-1,6-N-acetyl-D-glucosamine biosynthesis protein PgaD [Acinetobacter qingfengensis]|uniref:Poly-beta-1,6-N-acetyl-D-glucosamine biosynthesis protein PgaD n=1 Tax=Acinetobacter qingfengensis TaxID=1262585 RepID=A0A1E7RDZ5_9GAMM|nr:poly-beta-1,6-N-acetyl-D-glucosamine biosynthesis protein PgaD [Acinetobacter qingfengensis]OEY97630.1 poly-beta-1,6-N-acetyl-D-glucosamine biosynthesis protein PgaD [Acinetobacter qingfengensis]
MKNILQEFHIVTDPSKLDLPEYIDNPKYVTNKLSGYTLQIIGWALWMLICMPLFTLFFWWYEAKTISSYIFIDYDVARYNNLKHIGWAILVCGGLLLLWANYNWLRFRKTERRSKFANTRPDIFAENFNLNTQQLIELQESKNIILAYTDHATIDYYKIKNK